MKQVEIAAAVQFMAKPRAFVTDGPDGWSLHFHDEQDPNERVLDLEVARGGLRYFKTLDSAAQMARELGAWSLTVTM